MQKAMVWTAALAMLASGCATKKYVSRQVGEVNQKVDTLSTELEETQQKVAQHETKIQETQAGVVEAKGSADKAYTKAEQAEKAAKGKLIYTVTLSNDKVTFPVNRAEVSEDAGKVVDEALAPILAQNRGVYFEIEGHTDASGDEEYNKKLGEERAMAVRNYIHDKHGVVLARIEVISYGEKKPVADNGTREGRAQNRRVVIRVLE